jgi:hypothetical protein
MVSITANAFSVGNTIGTAFSVLFRNIVPFGILCLLVTAPSFLFWMLPGMGVSENYGVTDGGLSYSWNAVGGGVFAYLLQAVLGQLGTAALTYGTFQDLRGQRASLDECVRRGVWLILPVLGVAILATLAMFAGMLLLVIPGLIVATMLWVAIPVAVVERPGIVASLNRSAVLTKGHRWRILGILVLLGVISWALGWFVGIVLPLSGTYTLAAFGNWVVQAFTTALGAVIAAVSYHALRVSKEGGDINDIAAVFD